MMRRFTILKGMSLFMTIRAVPKEEGVGMDIINHGEEAYSTGEGAVLLLDDEAPAFITNGKVKPEPSLVS